jgi:endoribonuclease LACTB2
MAVNLPHLPDIEKLSTNIIRILGGNPSKFTLQGSNTYLLGSGPQRILLDTGEGRSAWSSSVSSVLESEKCSISQCLLSHWHGDHVGGVNALLKLSSSSPPTISKHMPTLNPHARFDPSILSEISPNQSFSTPEGFTIKSLHTPGHTKDHMCFLITSSPNQDEVGGIFTFDNVLGHGTAVFEDLAVYLNSLAVMKDALPTDRPVTAYPGHGAIIDDASAKIQEYIEHRHIREEEALNVLRYGTPTPPPSSPHSEAVEHESGSQDNIGALEVTAGKEWTSMEMVKVIYRHYPENLWQPAEGGLLMVLEKLKGDGKVKRSREGKWSVSERAAL